MKLKSPAISVIISTYNAVPWLEKTLWSYEQQLFHDFEIIIADDGSDSETKKFLDRFKQRNTLSIKHVWQEDQGFQKSMILNKALLECTADYVVMSDGDCVVRNDFLQCHYDRREPNCFLSGGYFKLPMSLSQIIAEEDIKSQRCFHLSWLRKNGLESRRKTLKLRARPPFSRWLESITPTNASWNGHNSSGWRDDILHVNGFDERMQYGGQDRELGERLNNYGVKSKQIRYSAICLHLDHSRGYRTPESIAKNRAIRQKTRREKIIQTPYGIQKP